VAGGGRDQPRAIVSVLHRHLPGVPEENKEMCHIKYPAPRAEFWSWDKSNTKQNYWQLDRDILLILSIAISVWMPIEGYVTCSTFMNLMLVDPCFMVQFIQKNPTRCNSASKFIIPYLYEAQHVSGDTPPIIKSLKLHLQPLVFHTCGSVLHGTIHTEKSNKMQQCIKIHYSVFV
jgi:hypothetical protein